MSKPNLATKLQGKWVSVQVCKICQFKCYHVIDMVKHIVEEHEGE